jgi:streptogrisin C
MDNFALAVNTVQEEHPEAFAGAEIVDPRGAWVGFAADAPEAAIEVIGTFEKAHATIAVEVRPGIGFSEVALGEAVATVHYAALDGAGVRDARTVFDYETRQITSTVAFDSTAAAAVEEVRKAASDRLVDSGLGHLLDTIAIDIVESSIPTLGGVDDNSAHIGGEAISTCTSGWSVAHPDGRSGIVTAGHCQAAQSDDGRALTHQTFHEGMFGDFQWHTGPQSEPDDFYSGNDTQLEVNRRDVAGAANPVVGQWLCKNGKTTFKSCDTVRATQICYAGYCNLVEMENKRSDSGDSGGPWFYNYTAYGVHHGWFWDPFPIQRNLFSKALSVFNALDVQIKR